MTTGTTRTFRNVYSSTSTFTTFCGFLFLRLPIVVGCNASLTTRGRVKEDALAGSCKRLLINHTVTVLSPVLVWTETSVGRLQPSRANDKPGIRSDSPVGFQLSAPYERWNYNPHPQESGILSVLLPTPNACRRESRSWPQSHCGRPFAVALLIP